MNRPRPVVALDVDGVLNAATGTPHRVLLTAGEVGHESPFGIFAGWRPGDPAWSTELTVRLHPWHAGWIRRLQRHADVCWATTWEARANLILAPLLGVDPLPVGVDTARFPPTGRELGSGSPEWKIRALADAYPDRPVLWVDDEAGLDADRATRGTVETHPITHATGVTMLEASQIGRWVIARTAG